MNRTAMFGLMAYPAQGVYKSIKAARGRNAAVKESKHLLLHWHKTLGGTQVDSRTVCADFEAQCQMLQNSTKK